MKKLFIISLFLCFFLIPKNTYALDFSVDNNIYQVEDIETLRDYIYFTYINDVNADLFFIEKNNNDKYFVGIPNNTSYLVSQFGTNQMAFSSSNSSVSFVTYKYLEFDSTFSLVSQNDNKTTWVGSRYGTGLHLIPVYYGDYYQQPELSYQGFTLVNGNYTYQEIINKYQSSSPDEPEEDEEVNMFDVVEVFLVQFINILPFIIPFILVMNLCCRLLFNERS